jgi:hypothetical protein
VAVLILIGIYAIGETNSLRNNTTNIRIIEVIT